MIRSGSQVTQFGANFVNTTGETIDSLVVTYDGEQYRRGGGSSTPDRIDFQYRVGGNDISGSGFTDVNALDFTSRESGSSPVSSLDGNAAAYRTAGITATLLGLGWAPGQTLNIRWTDLDIPSADDGLAVDNFSLAIPVATNPGTFSIENSSVRLVEDQAFADIIVNRSNGSAGAIDVIYTTADGTAVAGSDYTGVTNGVLSFADGQTTATISIPITNDQLDELDETFTVTLTSASGGASIGTAASSTVSIIDSDGATIASSPLTQDWSNVNLITAVTGWSGVQNIAGYNTEAAAQANGPASVLADQFDTTISNGGVVEFDGIDNPTIAIQGSGTANAPSVVFDVNTTSLSAVEFAFRLRDLDAASEAIQSIQVSYRIGNHPDSPFVALDVPGALIADATAPGADLETPVSLLLPAGLIGHDLVQLRVATADAAGSDEFVGIDDVYVGVPRVNPGQIQFSVPTFIATETGVNAVLTVNRVGGSSGTLSADYATADLTAIAGLDYTATTGTITFGDGDVTPQTIVVPVATDALDELEETFAVTLTNAANPAAIGTHATATVRLRDTNGHNLAAGSLTQDWQDSDLITANNDFSNVRNIAGYATLEDIEAGNTNVLANQTNGNISNGGVAEFENVDGNGNNTIGLNGSNAASEPSLIFDLDTRGITSATIDFDAIDLDSTRDDAFQPIYVAYRIGNAGPFITFAQIDDATIGDEAGLVTHLNATLPSEAIGQALVQLRIFTVNAAGNDEFVGIDNIIIAGQSASGLPAWVAPGSEATYDASTLTLTATGPTTIIADPGTDLPTIIASGSAAVVTIAPTADLRIQLGGLQLSNGATATLASIGANRSATNHRLLSVAASGLSIDATSRLDLADNDMVLRGAGDAGDDLVRDLIRSAASGGGGIASSLADGATTLGYALNDGALGLPTFTTFGPGSIPSEQESVFATDVLIKFTYAGDADLDGAVTAEDYAYIDFNFGNSGESLWAMGDFDHNGSTDAEDYAFIDFNFGNAGL